MSDHDGFDHNDQAIRVVHLLEKKYFDFDGLNLTWETLEGLEKHNGPGINSIPRTIKELNRKLKKKGKLTSKDFETAKYKEFDRADLPRYELKKKRW